MTINTSTPRYVQINIGSDMSSKLFSVRYISTRFQRDAIKALEDSVRGPFPTIEIHEGTGVWNGVEEDSLHISTIADVDTYALRVKLRELKTRYNQDAIALIVGSDLI